MDHLLFGAAYYDEYMPFDRIETDMQMMKKANMNVIRIAESTWSTLEPQDGVFDFTHLDRMLDAAEKYDMHVIIGTPTYAIPSWLAKKSDTILAVTKDGPSLYGHRQNMDITDPTYLKYAERIIRTLMEHIKDRSCIIGYQLDNETKHYGTAGKHAQELFVSYLKEQFPDLSAFNLEFGLDYWSNRVNDWSDFPDIRGTINGSLAAEYEKFSRKLVTDFLTWQSDLVREYKKEDQFITQNFDFEWHDYSYGLQPDVNQFEAAKCMDIAGCDIYHPSQDDLTGAEINFCGSIARGLKKSNYLILETEAQGNLEWLPYPGQLRMQAYSHLSCGADSVMYWHWHSIHNSLESYWKGVLSHDFSENPTYLEACRLGAEMKTYGSHLLHLKKTNRAAILVSNEALTGLRMFPFKGRENSSYNDAFGTGGELYSFTIAGPSLNIQGLKGDASMSVNNSKCICTMTVKLPRRAFAGLTVDTSNGNITIQDMTSQSNTLTTTNGNISITGGSLDSLNATANNGKVEVNNLLTQTFAASTRNGRISLANTSALSITAQAQNGDVKLDHTSSPYFYCTATNASVVGTVTGRGAEYGLNLTAGSGRVTLTDANDSSAPVQQNLGAAQSFTANASNGNVNLEFVQ